MSIGDNIKKYRNIKKITQSELAIKINKSIRMVQKYEADDVVPSLDIVEDIAKVLEISPTSLTGWEDFNNSLIEIYLRGIDIWSNSQFLSKEESGIIKMHFAGFLLRYKALVNKVVDKKFSFKEFANHYAEDNSELEVSLNENQIKELFWEEELNKEIEDVVGWMKAFTRYISGVYPNPNK